MVTTSPAPPLAKTSTCTVTSSQPLPSRGFSPVHAPVSQTSVFGLGGVGGCVGTLVGFVDQEEQGEFGRREGKSERNNIYSEREKTSIQPTTASRRSHWKESISRGLVWIDRTRLTRRTARCRPPR